MNLSTENLSILSMTCAVLQLMGIVLCILYILTYLFHHLKVDRSAPVMLGICGFAGVVNGFIWIPTAPMMGGAGAAFGILQITLAMIEASRTSSATDAPPTT